MAIELTEQQKTIQQQQRERFLRESLIAELMHALKAQKHAAFTGDAKTLPELAQDINSRVGRYVNALYPPEG